MNTREVECMNTTVTFEEAVGVFFVAISFQFRAHAQGETLTD